MNEQQEKEFIEQAFQTLKERGWLPELLEPTGITDQAIAAFEEKYQIKGFQNRNAATRRSVVSVPPRHSWDHGQNRRWELYAPISRNGRTADCNL